MMIRLLLMTSGLLLLFGQTSAAANADPPSGYQLQNLSALLPSGYVGLTPLAINASGEVAGNVFLRSAKDRVPPPFGRPVPSIRRGSSDPKSRVFTYTDGTLSIMPLPSLAVEAWFGGLNDAGELSVATCTKSSCNDYWVLQPVKPSGYDWQPLSGANSGTSGLGPIANDGDVTGAIAQNGLDVGVIWKAATDGSYAAPQQLAILKKSHFHRAYVPDAISSTLGQDVVGGALNTVEFYPGSQPVLWAKKMAYDRAFIGSHTLALGGAGQLLFAAVGCEAPVPACGPACPIDPVIWTVVVTQAGKPVVGNKLTLETPKPLHCGISPFSVVVGADNEPLTVGQAALTKGKKWVPRAVMWQGESITILNRMIAASKGTSLQSANAVNAAGLMAGTGRINGQPRDGWLLTPVGGSP